MTITEHWTCEPRSVSNGYRIKVELQRGQDFVAACHSYLFIFSEEDLSNALSELIDRAARTKQICINTAALNASL